MVNALQPRLAMAVDNVDIYKMLGLVFYLSWADFVSLSGGYESKF